MTIAFGDVDLPLTLSQQVWQTAAEGTRLVFIEAGDDMDMDDGDDMF